MKVNKIKEIIKLVFKESSLNIEITEYETIPICYIFQIKKKWWLGITLLAEIKKNILKNPWDSVVYIKN